MADSNSANAMPASIGVIVSSTAPGSSSTPAAHGAGNSGSTSNISNLIHSSAGGSGSGHNSASHSHNRSTSVIRFQKACEPCRRRKTKCDRLAPCASCVLRATERLCYNGTDSQEAVLVYPGASAAAAAVAAYDRHPDVHTDGAGGKPVSPSSSSFSPASSSSQSGQREGGPPFESADPTHGQQHTGYGRASKRPRHDRSPDGGTGGRSHQHHAHTGPSGHAGSSRHRDREHSRTHDGTPILPSSVSWHDCRQYLPAPEACLDLFLCFFNELDGHFACVHPLHIERIWAQLQHQGSVPRSSAALIFVIVALSMSLAPKSNPAHRAVALSRLSATDLFQIAADSLQLEIVREHREVSLTAPDFERLQALDLCCHFANMNGLETQAWFLISFTARLGKSLELFDERHWRPISSELDQEMRRRVAWDMIVLDRWQAIFKNRQGDLEHHVFVQKPSLHTFARYDFATGALLQSQDGLSSSRFALMAPDTPQTFFFLRARNELADIIADTHELIRALPTMRPQMQHETAMAIEAAADKHEAGLSPDLDYNYASSAAHALQSRPSRPLQRAALALTSWSSLWYVRCVLTRVFLQDVTADKKLRFASLKYARNIIESMHATVSLSASPWIAFSAGWTTQHIFAAATTFASIFLSGADTGPNPSEFRNEDLDSIASSLFEVVKTLDILSAYGNTAAGISREILCRSLNATESLRQRYRDFTAAQRRVHADQHNRVAPPAPSFLLAPGPAMAAVPAYAQGPTPTPTLDRFPPQDHSLHAGPSGAAAPHLGTQGQQGQRHPRVEHGHGHGHGQVQVQAQAHAHAQGQGHSHSMMQTAYAPLGAGNPGSRPTQYLQEQQQQQQQQQPVSAPMMVTSAGGALGGLVVEDHSRPVLGPAMTHDFIPIYTSANGVPISAATAMPAVAVAGPGSAGLGSDVVGGGGGGGGGPGGGAPPMNPDSTDLLLGILNMTEADWRAIL